MYENIKPDKTLGGTLPKLLQGRAKSIADYPLQGSKDKTGEFVYYSYAQVYQSVIELSYVFWQIGIEKGSHVGLISDNRREWLLSDMAILSLGACDVPRGCDSTANEICFILDFADCGVAIFETEYQLQKVLDNTKEVPLLKTAILFEGVSEDTKRRAFDFGINVYDFKELERKSKSVTQEQKKQIEAGIENILPGDIATIIFTSGTTGTPKGVMLTHDNYMALLEYAYFLLPAKTGDKWLSILPVWHSFERSIQYYAMALNMCLCYSKPVAALMLQDMQKTKPNWICGVPRLWEAFARGIQKAIKKEGGVTALIFSVSLAVGKAWYFAKNKVFGLTSRFNFRPRIFDTIVWFLPYILLCPPRALFDVLVYKKIKQKFGGNFKAGISGGGGLPCEIDAFYNAIGVRLIEGYGITEAAPVLSVRYIYKPRSGCVGEVYPGCKAKVVAEDHGHITSYEPLPLCTQGVLLVKGRQIMKGYYKRPDLTASVMTQDSWFNTGDIVALSCDKEIKILGRAKDTIVLLDGENIEPFLIEQAICASTFIDNVVVVGQDQRYLGALIVPNQEALTLWAKENSLDFSDWGGLLQKQQTKALIQQQINERVSTKTGFRPCERVARFCLLENTFEQNKEINGKMEVMRYKVTKIYENKIKQLFI